MNYLGLCVETLLVTSVAITQLLADTDLADDEISLAGSILRKSQRQSGQRVATEKTM
jgi:hypothetical protein